MRTSTRQVNGVIIVDCSGCITLGEGSMILKDMVRELLSMGQKEILLNLGNVDYIDSSGIAELISAQLLATPEGQHARKGAKFVGAVYEITSGHVRFLT